VSVLLTPLFFFEEVPCQDLRSRIPIVNLEKQIQKAAARTILQMPGAVARILAGPPQTDGERTLDPRIQLMMKLSRASGSPPLRAGGVDSSRKHYRVIAAAADVIPTAPLSVRDAVLSVGDRDLPVRVYHPEGFDRALPFILYFHGGGFVIGDLDTHDSLCRRLSFASGSAVVSLDYRRAPEHPFPAAIEDGKAALTALRECPEKFALDGERCALAGDSAGGNLAAVISPGAGLKGQLLYYPATDSSKITPSKRLFAEGLGLDGEDIRFFMSHYAEGVSPLDPRLSPSLNPDIGLSPNTRVVVAGFDPLRDEGREYARLLEDAGVPVNLIEQSGWTHGYLHMGALPGVVDSIHQDGLQVGTWLRS
jgi:acetyl esterase